MEKVPLSFLLQRIDYERARSMPRSEEAFKLDRMRELLRLLDNPQQGMRAVHIAGTKGKGSTAAMTAAVLSAAGFKTGLFTSPHLERVEERIVIDGRQCSEAEFLELVEIVRPAVEKLDREAEKKQPSEHGPTYFEIITAAAFLHFARRRVDVAVLEVGLGGRLDSTNVCEPAVSVITSISLDHTGQLGDTPAKIAAEKAGIIKPGVPVVSGVTDAEPREVVRATARRNGCWLVELGVDFDFEYRPARHLELSAAQATMDFRWLRGGGADCRDVGLGLIGRHQAANAAVALAAIDELRRAGFSIPEAAIRKGLGEVSWPARVEIVSRHPTVVLDAAHNAASIAALVETLSESFGNRRRLLVFATTREKDVLGMLSCLAGQFDCVFFTQYRENPRGVPAEELQKIATDTLGMTNTEIAASPGDAWSAVTRIACPDDLICITGSFFIAGEMRREI